MLLEPLCFLEPAAEVFEQRHAHVGVCGIVGARRIEAKNLGPLDHYWFHHMPADRVKNQLGPRAWDRYRKVSCVRNPFSRLVSFYYWLKKDSGRNTPKETHELIADFRRFVASKAWQNDLKIVFIGDDFIPTDLIRFEHLKEDCAAFLASIGASHINVETALTHTKDTSKIRSPITFADYFDDATRDVVLKRCGWMFEYLNYDTALPDP